LCFTVPAARAGELAAIQDIVKCPLTCIGSLVAAEGLDLRENGRGLTIDTRGFDHFAGT
jgi:thiamine monophosphate kinase